MWGGVENVGGGVENVGVMGVYMSVSVGGGQGVCVERERERCWCICVDYIIESTVVILFEVSGFIYLSVTY